MEILIHLFGRRLVGNETDALDLTVVVESDDTDVSVRVRFLGFLDLGQDLSCVGAPEHGELPHGPVATVVVSGGSVVLTVNVCFPNFEFQARNPVAPEKVVNFLEQLLVSQIWKVRKSLELQFASRGPHLHALNSSSIAGQSSDVIGLLVDGEGCGRLEAGEGCHHVGLHRGSALDGGDGGG